MGFDDRNQDQIILLERQVASLKNEVAFWKKREDDVVNQLQDALEDLEDMQGKVNTLTAESAAKDDLIMKTSKELAALEGKILTLEHASKSKADISADLTAKDEEIVKRDEMIGQMMSEIDVLKAQVADSNKQAEVDRLNRVIDLLLDKLNATD